MAKTEFEQVIDKQLGRIAHLPGFPREVEAIKDYKSALAILLTPQSVTRLIGDIVNDPGIERCPTSATIREMASERMRVQHKSQRECDICAGSGSVTVYKLVTYKGNSYVVDRAETITGSPAKPDWVAARELSERIAANPGSARQMVLTAAKECQCRRAVA